MHRTCLALARLSAAVWIGAALLFVVTSVAEQVHPAFDAATKNTLALIRFPWYYGTGFTLLAVACLATRFTRLVPRTRIAAMLLLMAALGLMSADYTFVYRPIRTMLSEAEARHDSEFESKFERLHDWSERINIAGILLALAAAVTLCAAQSLSETAGREPSVTERE